MAGKKSRASRVSNGGRQKANVAHEAKRQAKFAERRANGTNYVYKPNPYEPGTVEWAREKADRAEKAKSSKLPYARMRSIFAKLDNEIAKDQERARQARENRKTKKDKAATA